MLVPAHAAAPSLESSIARLNRRIDGSTRTLDELKKQAAGLTKQLEVARAVGDHPDWSLLLSAVARSRADSAVLESFDLTILKIDDKPDKPGASPAKTAKPAREVFIVKLLGSCATPGACFQFARTLESLDIFERVVVKDTHAQQLGQMNVTRFEIEATLNASPTPAPAPVSSVPRPTAPPSIRTPSAPPKAGATAPDSAPSSEKGASK